jgi:putative transposase
MLKKKKKINEYIIDETAVKVGSELIWLWVIIEPIDKENLSINISKKRNMFVVERFISKVIKEYGKHSASTDGGTWYSHQACKFLKLNHHTRSSFEKSIIERTMQYIKDRTESFDDYFPCKRKKCKIKYVFNWLKLIFRLS